MKYLLLFLFAGCATIDGKLSFSPIAGQNEPSVVFMSHEKPKRIVLQYHAASDVEFSKQRSNELAVEFCGVYASLSSEEVVRVGRHDYVNAFYRCN